MKKLLTLLLCMLLLPAWALAEETAIPEGYRVVDFGDFTLPIAPNALVTHYDKDEEDGYVAEIRYLDLSCKQYAPLVVINWSPNNMSAYLKGAHPLKYADSLRQNTVDTWTADDMVISEHKTIHGTVRNGQFTALFYCRMEDNGFLTTKPHDLWLVQRFYGTYDMGTYYFDVYAESREWADRIIEDLDRIAYKE